VSLPGDYTNKELRAALEAHAWNIGRAADALACKRESMRVAARTRLSTEYAKKKADGSIRVGYRGGAR